MTPVTSWHSLWVAIEQLSVVFNDLACGVIMGHHRPVARVRVNHTLRSPKPAVIPSTRHQSPTHCRVT